MLKEEIMKLAADSYLQGQKDMIMAMRDALDLLDKQLYEHERDADVAIDTAIKDVENGT